MVVAAGGRVADQEIASRSLPLVRRIVRGMLGGDPEAEDAEQETMLHVLRGRSTFEGRGAWEGWVRKIAVRTCLRFLRSRRWRRFFFREVTELVGREAVPGEFEGFEKLLRALDRLTSRERSAFVLKYQEGLPFEEVASAMGCRAGTARNYAFRASRKLRRYLGGCV